MFLVVVIVGGIGIVFLRGYPGLWQGYAIGWALACMLLYLILITMEERYRLRLDQAGDNLYYLGFLYTLVSLSIALYYFSNSKLALEQIISNFGIALATTIFGIALRVVLHQMREDPLDTEREARLSLAETARKLRAELDISAQEISGFTRQMRQSVEEAFSEIGKKASTTLGESGEQVAGVARGAKSGIEDAFSTFAQQAKSLNAATRRQVQVTEKLVERIEAIDVPANLIERKLAPAVDKMTRLADELEKRTRSESKALKEVEAVVAEIGQAATSMNQHAEAAGGFAERVLPLVERLEGVTRALAAVGDGATNLAEAQKQAVENQIAALEAQVVRVGELRDRAAQEVEQFSSRLGELRETSARETAEVLRAIAEAQRAAGGEYSREAAESLRALQQHRAAIEAEAGRARAATEEVARQLASMARTLASELGGSPAETRRSV